MNFGATGRILVDRQRLLLAAQIEHLQNVVEDLAQGQFGHRSTVPTREMRQDKFVELRIAQLHWNAVPRLAFGHLDPESIEILADSPHIDKRQTCKGFQTNSRAGKTCNQLLDLAKTVFVRPNKFMVASSGPRMRRGDDVYADSPR
jgi:hypothetical protein